MMTMEKPRYTEFNNITNWKLLLLIFINKKFFSFRYIKESCILFKLTNIHQLLFIFAGKSHIYILKLNICINQGIVNKSKANAIILAKAASEPDRSDAETDTFYAKKAAKDHEVAKNLIREQLNTQAFQSQVGRVQERGPHSKLMSTERKILCLAAYSMIDLEYSAWISIPRRG